CPGTERLAKKWLSQCTLEGPDASVDRDYIDVGLNYEMVVGKKPTLSKIVRKWIKERKNYVYANNTCTGNCDHYTRMVWGWTSLLGCAINRCDNLQTNPRKPVHLVACMYEARCVYFPEP
uniref:SCP domain-containing protein n=1 Tax=Mesocestoides corti TaxID=53468 RepID=A0A5K3F1L8_MESCO